MIRNRLINCIDISRCHLLKQIQRHLDPITIISSLITNKIRYWWLEWRNIKMWYQNYQPTINQSIIRTSLTSIMLKTLRCIRTWGILCKNHRWNIGNRSVCLITSHRRNSSIQPMGPIMIRSRMSSLIRYWGMWRDHMYIINMIIEISQCGLIWWIV